MSESGGSDLGEDTARLCDRPVAIGGSGFDEEEAVGRTRALSDDPDVLVRRECCKVRNTQGSRVPNSPDHLLERTHHVVEDGRGSATVGTARAPLERRPKPHGRHDGVAASAVLDVCGSECVGAARVGRFGEGGERRPIRDGVF